MSSEGHHHEDQAKKATTYWMFAGSVIAVATLVNIIDKLLYRQRLRSAGRGESDPAKPKNFLVKAWAALTALSREFAYLTPPPLLAKYPQFNLLPLGNLFLIAANICLILPLCFHGFNLQNNRTWEDLAVRCAWVTLAQLPLVFMMTGKRNIVGLLTGTSYERLNWIHRWIARCMFLTATLHMAYFFRSWDRYNYTSKKLKTDIISRRGLGAWCILLWIIVSSFGPIRNLRYEIFAVQHFVSVVGFITMIMLHTPTRAHAWIWVPIGIAILERLCRMVYIIYDNITIFHRKGSSDTSSTKPSSKAMLHCKAILTPLPDRATRVSIQNPPWSWGPGQHANLICPTLIPFQSHPFTISSLPSDSTLEFVIRAHGGATSRIFDRANTQLPPLEETTVVLDGPYGRLRPLEQFDTVVLIAGSTGATFTVPLVRDLVRRWDALKDCPGVAHGLVTRRVKFVWVVKNRGQISWFAKELKGIYECLNEEVLKGDEQTAVKLHVETSIYITCDETITVQGSLAPGDVVSSNTTTQDTRENAAEKAEGGDAATTATTGMFCGGDKCCCIDNIDEDAILPVTSDLSPVGADSPNPTFSSLFPSIPDYKPRTCICGVPLPKPISATTAAITEAEPETMQQALGIPEDVHVLTGRPAVKKLIERELGKARGESAVVACGPVGLVGLVRRSVVSLSDERAASKGSGAMGVYLHTEAFCW